MSQASLKYTLLILGSPYNSNSAQSAYRFANALLASGHTLYRVFFYHDAVQSGSSLAIAPQELSDLSADWQALINQHELDAVICIASALKRGVINEQESKRYEKSANNLLPGYDLSGLGQLVDASLHSDRVVTFGN